MYIDAHIMEFINICNINILFIRVCIENTLIIILLKSV